MVHAQFRHAFADRFHIAEVAKRKPPDAQQDAGLRHRVPEASEPRCIRKCLADFNHGITVSYKIRIVNGQFGLGFSVCFLPNVRPVLPLPSWPATTDRSSAGSGQHQAVVRVESSLFRQSTPSTNRSPDHEAIKSHKQWFTSKHGRFFSATDFADCADFVWLRDELEPTLPIREIRAIRS